MRSRCYNSNFPRFADYGGRGITICDEWRYVQAFKQWAEQNGYTDGLCIERIDNEGNYSPENCKWTTKKEQSRNKRNSRRLTIFQETKTVAEWAEDPRCKVSSVLLRKRLLNKWDAARAVSQPKEIIAKQQERLVAYQGETRTIHSWCKLLGLKPATIYARERRGLSPEEILAPVKIIAPYGSRKHKTQASCLTVPSTE